MLTRFLVILNSILLCCSVFQWTTPSNNFSSKEKINASSVLSASPDMFCDGTLGENIFTDGDFGSGTVTNLPSDVNGYAPGYDYQSSPPPNDGFYTITSNTTFWGSFANSSWVNTGDNSNDPNGYMMVVNASFSPGIFYENTVDNLCENTTYQFTTDVINLIKPGLNMIKPKLEFLINDVVQYSTGTIVEDGQWNTYGFTFVSAPGTNTLKLTVRNSAPGGNGNDIALDNIEFRACGPEININTSIEFVCDGESASLVAEIIGTQYDSPFYQWQSSMDNGVTWNNVAGANNEELFIGIPNDGDLYRLLVSNSPATIDNPKCRVISNEQEIEITPIYFTHYDTICQGLNLQVGTSLYDVSGTYLDSLIATYNCDSIVTTHLTVVPDLGITADFEKVNPFCPGDPNGNITIENVQNGSGQYTYSLNGDPYQTTPFFEYLPTGDYLISILDHYGCEATIEVQLVDPNPLMVNVGEDQLILLGEDYLIPTSANLPVGEVSWTPEAGLSCSDCLNPIASPAETTTYQVTVTDTNGCVLITSLTIEVDKTRKIFIPNAFSPDGDGYNDYFTINSGFGVETIVSFEIYNRWGAVVFSQKNILPNDDNFGWDGFFNGKKMDSGVYVYNAEILFKDGLTERFVGDVTVVE